LKKICDEDIQNHQQTSPMSSPIDSELLKLEEARLNNQQEALYQSSRHIKQNSDA
jgi:hypothetical protein